MDFDKILDEVEFSTALSGGSGGQHVNKTETKVNLKWLVDEGNILNAEQKQRIKRRLQNKINKEGALRLSCADSRSQHQNKKNLIQKFKELLKQALAKPKKRKSTQPTKKSKLKRLKNKAKHAEKKSLRQKPKI